jgi:hypothetical protein
VLVDADDPHPVQATGVGGHDHRGGVHGDAVDGIPRQAQLPCYCGDGGPVDHQSPQDVAGAPPGGRPAWVSEPGSVVGEHFPLAVGRCATVAGYSHPQPQRMPDNGYISHPPDHGVTVDTLTTAARTVALAVVEQVAEQHRDIAVDGGVGDRHPQLHSPHDRVGDNRSSRRRRVRHRAPRQVGGKA